MNKLESNVMHSFKLAKNDIIKLQQSINDLSKNQEKFLDIVKKVHELENTLNHKIKELEGKTKIKPGKIKIVDRIINKKVKKIFVASKTGKTFHVVNCPFARNIKPKAIIKLKTKNRALNLGYKPCKCVSR